MGFMRIPEMEKDYNMGVNLQVVPRLPQNHTYFTNSPKLCQTLNDFKSYLIVYLFISSK